MTAVVVPFPLARRLDLIQRQAEYALCLKPEKGDQHIHRQLQAQAEAMRRRGIAQHIIDRELTSMAGAIRAVMWRMTFDTPGEA